MHNQTLMVIQYCFDLHLEFVKNAYYLLNWTKGKRRKMLTNQLGYVHLNEHYTFKMDAFLEV